jgi:large subunit ribosomal protein L36e
MYPPPANSHCRDDGLSMQVSAVVNTLSEIVIAILPVFAVFRLQVDPRQRWGVIGLLSLSFFVAFTGCFRTFFIFKMVQSEDFTWWSSPQWITSEVEIDLGLVSYSMLYPPQIELANFP